MEVKLDISTENEGTDSPWWMIIDPQQMMEPSPAEVAMGMITGPFFSREEAEDVLRARSHHYSHRAVVWCASGCYTRQYRKQWKEAELKDRKEILK